MSKSTPPSVKIISGSSSSSLDVLAYVPDLDEWPDSWMIDQPDRAVGKAIVSVLTPFIEHLINQGLTKRTIKRHVDNLWALGGEIISDINWNESLRKQSAKVLVINTIDEEGGPLLRNPLDPDDQKPFDSTCRKLYKFLTS
jgi:hypothetical protein